MEVQMNLALVLSEDSVRLHGCQPKAETGEKQSLTRS